jgi:hypothetical protein
VDGIYERDVNTPDFAFDGHPVGLQRILCLAA